VPIQIIHTSHRWRILQKNVLRMPQGLLWKLVGKLCRGVVWELDIDRAIGWVKPAQRACEWLRPGEVDLVFASYPPPAPLVAASRVARRLGCPLVFDYRDLWTAHPFTLRWRRPWIVRQEQRLVGQAAALTTVSWGCAESLERGFGRRAHVITNGYDPEELAGLSPRSFEEFAIVYAGVFYPPKSVVTPIMAALGHVARQTTGNNAAFPPWRFHYFGPQTEHVLQQAQAHGVADRVVCHGRVPRAEALAAIKGADLAAVVTTVNDQPSVEDRGVVTSKVFDVMGAGTRVLLIAPPGSDAQRIVAQSGCGECFSGGQTQAMAGFILRAMRGELPPVQPPAEFAWPAISNKLDVVLREALAGPQPCGWPAAREHATR